MQSLTFQTFFMNLYDQRVSSGRIHTCSILIDKWPNTGAFEQMNRRKFIQLVLCLVYVAGYIGARNTHMIIHRSGFSTDRATGEIETRTHYVTNGDIGIPMFNPTGSLLIVITGWVYFPMRALEQFAWYLIVPEGSAWPYTLVQING